MVYFVYFSLREGGPVLILNKINKVHSLRVHLLFNLQFLLLFCFMTTVDVVD